MRVKNEKKRAVYQQVFEAQQATHPLLCRTQVIALMHERSGVPLATLRYYLKTEKDLRRKYDDATLERLSMASVEELEAEALARGITLQSLRTAVSHNLGMKSRRSPVLQREAKLAAELYGWFRWTDGFTLGAYGLSRRLVQLSRKALRGKWGLDLVLPHHLTHLETGRVIALRLPEQLVIIQDPIGFVKATAKDLGSRWQPAEVKP